MSKGERERGREGEREREREGERTGQGALFRSLAPAGHAREREAGGALGLSLHPTALFVLRQDTL